MNYWDELQDTILIVGALVLWGGFEVLCFLKEQFATSPHTAGTRIALITICTNLFTYRSTRSSPEYQKKRGNICKPKRY